MLLRTPLPPLLLLPWLPAAAGPGAAAELWHPLTYAQGFDDHDPVACLGGQHGTPAAAECSTAAGTVRLRGCAMCLSYVETCFDRPGTRLPSRRSFGEEQNQPFLTRDAPADRARVRSSESITRANPRVYRVGAAFGRERLICASAPCDGELGDRAKQPKIGYASAE